MARRKGGGAGGDGSEDDADFVAESEDDDFEPETKRKSKNKAKATEKPLGKRKAAAPAAPPAPKSDAAKRPFFGAAAVPKRDDNGGGNGAQSSDGGAAAASCPICGRSFAHASAVNAHLDACLSRSVSGAAPSLAPARAASLPAVAAFARTPPPARAACYAPSPLQRGGDGGDGHVTASPAVATAGGTTCDDAALHAPLCAGDQLICPAAALPFRITGRRFHRQAAGCVAGACAVLRREPNNAADCNAILVIVQATAEDAHADVAAAPLGHVPAAIAAHLAPLLDRGWLRVQCTLPNGAVAAAAAPSADAPAAVAHGFAAAALPPRAAAALRAGWAAAHAAADAAACAGGRTAAQRRSFRLLLQTVTRRDASLFCRRHAAMLAAAAALDDAACTMLLQMYSRKGPWFRSSALHYADVPDIDAALEALVAAGMARAMPAPAAGGGSGNEGDDGYDDGGTSADDESDDEQSDRRSRFEVLNAAELRAAVSAAGGNVSGGARRGDALAALLRAPAARAEAAWAAAARRSARLRAGARAALRRAFLLFFLAPGADVLRFLLVDLGAISYPRTALRDADRDDVACRVFPSRPALDAYEAALRRRDALAAAAEAGNAAEAAVHCAAAAAALGIDATALRSLAGEAAEAIDVDAGVGAAVAGESPNTSSAIAPPQFARFTAAHVLAGCCSEGVALLERARRYADAVALLRALLALGSDCSSPPITDANHTSRPRPGLRGSWWLRLCTDLEHVGRADCALLAAESGLADPACGPADVAALQAKALRLAVPPRRWKPPPWAAEAAAAAAAHAPRVVRLPAPPALRSVAGRKSLFAAPQAAGHGDDVAAEALHAALPTSDATSSNAAAAAAAAALAAADADAGAPAAGAAPAEGPAPDAITVEALALSYYATQGGWRGTHSESGIWLTMFTLLFWPVIFDATGAMGAPRGVFQSAFQTAPLDFGTRCFAESRRDALAARLARIAAGDAPRLLAASWALHRGAAAAGVNWRAHSLAQLQAVAEGMRPAPLAALMRLLAADYAGWRAGLPDLVLWRGAPGSRETMLVEVKGPRDAMRPGQRAWALALGAAGVRMEIMQYE